MATPTDGMAAHGHLLSFAPLSRHGACWYYVWQAYARAGASTSMGSSATALEGWNLSSGKHPGDRNPPPGAAIWLGRRYDGNTDGDVFIAGAADGQHAATDYPTWGQVGLCSLQGRIDQTGREYLGWTDHVLDCPIIGATPAPAPTPIGVEMYVQSRVVPGRVFAVYTDAAGHVRMRLCDQFETAYALTGNLVITGEDDALNGLAQEALLDQPDTSVGDVAWAHYIDIVDVNGEPTGWQNATGYVLGLNYAMADEAIGPNRPDRGGHGHGRRRKPE